MSAPNRGGIVLLTHAGTDLTALHRAETELPEGFVPVAGVNLQTVDSAERMAALLAGPLADTRIVVVRVLGRAQTIPGFEELLKDAKAHERALIVVSGTGEPDPELAALSSVPPALQHEVTAYLQAGGSGNMAQLLRCLSDRLLMSGFGYQPPTPLPEHGIYHPELSGLATLDEWAAIRQPDWPTVGITFYRAHWMSGNTRFIDMLVDMLAERRLNALPVYTASLRTLDETGMPAALQFFGEPRPSVASESSARRPEHSDRDSTNGTARERAPRNAAIDSRSRMAGVPVIDVLINTTSFAMGDVNADGPTAAGWSVAAFERLDIPVIQAITSSMTQQQWEASERGLNPLDTAMNVALPEFDGRIVSVPMSFKHDEDETHYAPLADRVRRVAGIAARQVALRRIPAENKRIAFIFTNSNSKASQIGNAVGLDSPASLFTLLHAMREQGYHLPGLPESSDALIHELIDRGAYDEDYLTADQLSKAIASVPAARYAEWFGQLPDLLQQKMLERWGEAPGSAYVHEGKLVFAGLEFGNAFVALQPPRGYGMDPDAIYHTPDLPPTHHYYALYCWLRDDWKADAIVHVGKHGTLEWLPGKGVGVSEHCFPDALLGDLPMFYPFILNDPGEGSQAKRRAHSVIIDHLTPPMTTADTYGPLAQLTQLVDEYYQVEMLDPAKLPLLQQQIWDLIKEAKLDSDLAAMLGHDHDHGHAHEHHDHHGHEHGHHEHDHDHHEHAHPHAAATPASKYRMQPVKPAMKQTGAAASVGGQYRPTAAKPHSHGHDHHHGHGHDHHHHGHHDHDHHDHDHHHEWDATLNEDGVPLTLAKMEGVDVAHLIEDIDGYLCELGAAQIRDGLHILGKVPQGEALVDMVCALVRLPNLAIPSLPASIAAALGMDWNGLQDDKGKRLENVPPQLQALAGTPLVTRADALDAVNALGRRLVATLAEHGFDASVIDATLAEALPGSADTGAIKTTLAFVCRELVPNLARTTEEIANLLHGLAGGYVPAGPSGAPTRGMAHVLPTGRNFYSVDPRSLPSQAAWRIGTELANEVLARHRKETGHLPETVSISVWGTSAMRTHGDDIAEILALLGVRPRWQAESRRITGIEVIPLAELARPRIDVTVRISGFFRDAFPHLIHLVDEAVHTVARLDEPVEQNFVRKHYLADLGHDLFQGLPSEAAGQRALYRVFGSKPGTYGAGILPLINEQNWETDADFATAYINWGGYAYGQRDNGTDARADFRHRLSGVEVALHNQDNREHDIFDSDDYLQYHGGMIATIRSLTGRQPRHYFGDSHNPDNPAVRGLKEEVLRVFRSRVANPKWIASIQKHGYKGGLELTATVDYLFGYDATAHVVDDWVYEQLAETYALDQQMQDFFAESNPWALNAITERLLEAAQRRLWEEPNPDTLAALRDLHLQSEAMLEERGESPKR
ncbi:cobaltochelatase subunit CobN [Pseudogulbenkiania sp. NH8B]|uniref:cobaltochelatase subunit CobN n=1 Tax=Pseudogulbenkiania sp. (strain NH8B) TaxID=748280 RepID=UPI0002F273D3|nr:cobaltochelatase subunit CobN [Pseudogulbenkiania sp. NH8B]